MIAPITSFLSNAALLATLASALPAVSDHTALDASAMDSTLGKQTLVPHENQKRACSFKHKDLFIMTAGASQAVGYPSETPETAYEGYRPELARLLQEKNLTVSFSGSSSKMVNGQNQKWAGAPGMRIKDVVNTTQWAMSSDFPNVLIFNVGTPEVLYPTDLNIKGDNQDDILPRVEAMLTGTFDGFGIPGFTILSGLPIIKDDKFQARAHGLNAQYKRIAEKITKQGMCPVLFADVGSVLSESDLFDISNPTVNGYKKLAAVYADTLEQAACNGWV